MKTFILIAALAFSAVANARADDCGVTLGHAREIGRGVLTSNPNGAYTEYTGDEALKILDAINETPPVSAFAADTIIVIDAADGEAFRVGLSVDGCVERAFPVPREVWPGLVRAALGDGL
jgi:hypothetical protein